MLAEIAERCDTIEECYEFMLAYAGQGVPSDEGTQIRHHLARAVHALTGLAENCSKAIEKQRLEPAGKYQAFLKVVDRDARDSLAAIELVQAQPTISSQLIDNLNASIHLRALLTDLFLISEILKEQRKSDAPAVTSQ